MNFRMKNHEGISLLSIKSNFVNSNYNNMNSRTDLFDFSNNIFEELKGENEGVISNNKKVQKKAR